MHKSSSAIHVNITGSLPLLSNELLMTARGVLSNICSLYQETGIRLLKDFWTVAFKSTRSVCLISMLLRMQFLCFSSIFNIKDVSLIDLKDFEFLGFFLLLGRTPPWPFIKLLVKIENTLYFISTFLCKMSLKFPTLSVVLYSKNKLKAHFCSLSGV